MGDTGGVHFWASSERSARGPPEPVSQRRGGDGDGVGGGGGRGEADGEPAPGGGRRPAGDDEEGRLERQLLQARQRRPPPPRRQPRNLLAVLYTQPPPPFPPLFSPFSSLSRFKWSTDLFFFLIPLLLVLSVSTGRRRASFSLSFRRSQIVDVFVQVWWRPTPFGKYTVSEEGQAPGTYSCYLFRFPPPSPSSTWSLLLNWWHLCLHSIQLLVLYVDFKVDESYTPSKISIRAGDGFHNLKVIPHSGKRYCAPIFSLS